METLWFIIIAFMLTAYVVLDGFDLGAGIVQPLVARSPQERQAVLRAIGPFWDGNEVWLLAAGGTLYFAFPLLYASSFSGFYLPLMMVLWLLMLRGISIEFRAHLDSPVWRSLFDGIFVFSSTLLAIFFGAALGNVIRGVPLQADGFFFEPLFTDFRTTGQTGILDWYTVLAGIIALVALASHGALYLAWKTAGEVAVRARATAARLWYALVALTLLGLLATLYVRPAVLDNYRAHSLGLLVPLAVIAALIAMFWYRRSGRDRAAFLASALYLAAMLVGAAFGLYPNVLPASTASGYGLTIANTAAAASGLRIGLFWWPIGMLLAVGYFVFLYRIFAGRVSPDSSEGTY